MSALTFDKSELGNLEYSLQREMLATDRIGGYMSTTIVCCNTRRYHGLMVAPIDDSDRTYVLLSALDETIIQHDQTFNLALHRFQGTYEPRGHKYITDFEYTPTPTITYRVGGVILKKEMLWIHKRTQLMIRYTLVDAHSETRLRLRPFLAFRDKHALTHANMEADGHSYPESERHARIGNLFAHFDLAQVSKAKASELDSEKRHLLAIAAALSFEPSAIVADEPSKGLDEIGAAHVAKALFSYNKQVIFATHDTDMIRRPEYAIDRVLVLDEHAVAFDGAPAEAVAFYEDLIRRKYEAAKR